MGESHVLEQSKSRTNIGAAFERTASAVDHEIRCSRKRSGPLLNVCQPLLGGSAAVECTTCGKATWMQPSASAQGDRHRRICVLRGASARVISRMQGTDTVGRAKDVASCK